MTDTVAKRPIAAAVQTDLDPLRHDLPNTASSDVPAAFLPYQQRWVEDNSDLKVAEKSRRTGLTWAEAGDDVLIAGRARSAGGMNVYYIGYNMDMAIEYIEACAMWARIFGQACGVMEEGEELFEDGKDDRAIKTYTIRFASGFRIVALSSRPANLRGKQGVVVIDEAAFHGQLDELLKAAIALLMWGGKVRIISTHDGVDNPFNQLIEDIRAGKRSGSVHRIAFDEACAEGLYHRVCLRQGKAWTQETEDAWKATIRKTYGDAASEELDAIPSQGSGSWLSGVLIEARMYAAPVLRYTCPAGFEKEPDVYRYQVIQEWLDFEVAPLLAALDPMLQSVLGEDFGRSGDLTVITPAQIEQNLTRRIPFMLELRNMPHRQQEQILFYLCDRLPNFVKAAVDARGNGSAVAEFLAQRYGYTRIDLIMATDGWYREQMPPLKAAFEDGTILVPRDKDTASDLRLVKMIRGVARVPEQRTTGKDGNKRHGDAAISIAMMHYASRNPGAPIEWESVPARVRGFDGDADDVLALGDEPQYHSGSKAW
jgi:phage FluMu gp28-like protein